MIVRQNQLVKSYSSAVEHPYQLPLLLGKSMTGWWKMCIIMVKSKAITTPSLWVLLRVCTKLVI
jgi:hypothetical protein